MPQFYSNGKLLITGEYTVLDGALALALPTVFGQYLTLKETDQPVIKWQSFDEHNQVWFDTVVNFNGNHLQTNPSNDAVADKLVQILQAALLLNPAFLADAKGYDVTTKLTFNRHWGLGSSSTLINNIADWAQVDAYQLLARTFGGSGYDIACAKYNTAITYQLKDSGLSIVTPTAFSPSFKEQLYFVYLNKKQNSRNAIAHYKAAKHTTPSVIDEISALTKAIINCDDAMSFDELIQNHESIVSTLLKIDSIKVYNFNDFNGSIKSLGAWGGDFVMVRSDEQPDNYFRNKGFNVVIPFTEMIK